MTVQRLATAALLHDIGKFWSRTSQSPPYTDQERDHFGTYAHALWTGHFVERHLDDPVMASWARMHHAPDSRESLLISLADWLSSSERHEDDDRDRGAPQDAALESILATLRLNGQSAADDRRWYLPLRPHGDFADGFFPRQDLKLGRADYDALWRAFETEVRSIDAAKAPLGTWMALLRKFTSRIPSATRWPSMIKSPRGLPWRFPHPFPFIDTQALMVSLIRAGVLSVGEADAIKTDWEMNHSFALRIATFGELL